MSLDLNLNEEEKQGIESRITKSVSIPTGSLCEVLLYDIDFPKKVKDEAAQLRVKPTILRGLTLRFVTLAYYDKDRKITVIDFTDPDNIQFPLGEKGFKNIAYFGTSEQWSNVQKLVTPYTDSEAKQNFNIWMEKNFGIPMDMEKGKSGIIFHNFRFWKISDPKPGETRGEYKSWLTARHPELKITLTPEQIGPKVLAEEITAKIWEAVEKTPGVPF